MSYTLNLLDHYAGVRSRLYGAKVVMALAAPAAVAIEAPVFEPDDDFEESEDAPHGVPLNMLGKPSWRFLLALAAAKHGVGQREILSNTRFTHIVAARQYASALVYQHTQASVCQVAQSFGLNHTTVLHTLKKLDARRKLVEVHDWTYARLRTKSRDMIMLADNCGPPEVRA